LQGFSREKVLTTAFSDKEYIKILCEDAKTTVFANESPAIAKNF
jgi:hypothetical protein